jgi:two-component system phosphate regulon sensor histidine kinase PhoR
MSMKRMTITLMTTSIMLLLVLQAFWLRSVYDNQRRDLERDVSILFGNTILEMNDSLMAKNIETLPSHDTVKGSWRGTMRFTTRIRRDSFDVVRHVEGPGGHDSSKSVQVFIYSDKGRDSVKRYLRPLISRFRNNPAENAFTIQLTGDSLRIADVKRKLDHALATSGIELPPDAIKVGYVTPDQAKSRKRQVVFTPSGGFSAEFVNLKWVVLKSITPQIVFAIFLTLITSTSFIVMYRNVRSQQRLMTQKNEFISNVTHELKTPIATVSVALEALKNFKGIENPKLTEEYLDIARHELDRLAVLADKVLTTSLFDERGMTMEKESVDIENVIDGVVFAMGPIFEKNKGSVKTHKSGADFRIIGSNVHLTNVIYNLLDNAIKYSASAPSAVIDLKDLGSNIFFSVSDTGSGIAEEYHKKIFEKFFRVPTGDVHNIKGHGLGLSYVASVIEKHGGKISVVSTAGKGSTFSVVVPKNRV